MIQIGCVSIARARYPYALGACPCGPNEHHNDNQHTRTRYGTVQLQVLVRFLIKYYKSNLLCLLSPSAQATLGRSVWSPHFQFHTWRGPAYSSVYKNSKRN